MFTSYALAIGLGLAVVGLFYEMTNHYRWSMRRKGWGSTFVTVGTMGVVLLIAERVSHVAMATACSCAVLALSMRVSQVTIVEKETQPEPHSIWETTEEEVVDEEQEYVEEVQFVDEEQEHVEEIQAVDEAQRELVEEVSSDWLNMQIANGFETKSKGLYEQALQSFEMAVIYCKDVELYDMLKDEIADCYFSMALAGSLSILRAS